ncbi:hypothetical protein ACP4OV_015872 [Aristida adscensionis]
MGFSHEGVGGVCQPSFRILCKADEGYCLAVREGSVALARTDPRDDHQHWFKDTSFSTLARDEEGNPGFSLVNKATGLAIKHSRGQHHPVRLVWFDLDRHGESVLWTESRDLGKDFGCIRMLNDISLIFDAFCGDNRVQEGTAIVTSKWANSNSQSWKILPWIDPSVQDEPTFRVFCKANDGLCMTIRNGTVCLARTDLWDDYQHWKKDTRYSSRVKDMEGFPAFSLINKITGEAIKHSVDKGHPVKLVPYNPNYIEKSVLWTNSCDAGLGFRCIRMVDCTHLNFEAFQGGNDPGMVSDGARILISDSCEGDNQHWKIVPWGNAVFDWSICHKSSSVYYCSIKANTVGCNRERTFHKGQPVKLVPYNPNYIEKSVLWTNSCDTGLGFRCIRMVDRTHLNLEAFQGDNDPKMVSDGTSIVISDSYQGDNYHWNIVPWGNAVVLNNP